MKDRMPIITHIPSIAKLATNLLAPKSISNRKIITELMPPCAKTAGQMLFELIDNKPKKKETKTVTKGKIKKAPHTGYSG